LGILINSNKYPTMWQLIISTNKEKQTPPGNASLFNVKNIRNQHVNDRIKNTIMPFIRWFLFRKHDFIKIIWKSEFNLVPIEWSILVEMFICDFLTLSISISDILVKSDFKKKISSFNKQAQKFNLSNFLDETILFFWFGN